MNVWYINFVFKGGSKQIILFLCVCVRACVRTCIYTEMQCRNDIHIVTGGK